MEDKNEVLDITIIKLIPILLNKLARSNGLILLDGFLEFGTVSHEAGERYEDIQDVKPNADSLIQILFLQVTTWSAAQATAQSFKPDFVIPKGGSPDEGLFDTIVPENGPSDESSTARLAESRRTSPIFRM